jgi:hypothetical protein
MSPLAETRALTQGPQLVGIVPISHEHQTNISQAFMAECLKEGLNPLFGYESSCIDYPYEITVSHTLLSRVKHLRVHAESREIQLFFWDTEGPDNPEQFGAHRSNCSSPLAHPFGKQTPQQTVSSQVSVITPKGDY